MSSRDLNLSIFFSMAGRKGGMAIWAAVTLATFWYGLSGGAAQWELIGAMLTGGGGAEGTGMILFMLMGFWPAAFFLLWFPVRHRFRPGPLPFVVLAFAAGAFALIPYLILRVPTEENPSGAGSGPTEYRRRSVGLKAAALILLGADDRDIASLYRGGESGTVRPNLA